MDQGDTDEGADQLPLLEATAEKKKKKQSKKSKSLAPPGTGEGAASLPPDDASSTEVRQPLAGNIIGNGRSNKTTTGVLALSTQEKRPWARLVTTAPLRPAAKSPGSTQKGLTAFVEATVIDWGSGKPDFVLGLSPVDKQTALQIQDGSTRLGERLAEIAYASKDGAIMVNGKVMAMAEHVNLAGHRLGIGMEELHDGRVVLVCTRNGLRVGEHVLASESATFALTGALVPCLEVRGSGLRVIGHVVERKPVKDGMPANTVVAFNLVKVRLRKVRVPMEESSGWFSSSSHSVYVSLRMLAGSDYAWLSDSQKLKKKKPSEAKRSSLGGDDGRIQVATWEEGKADFEFDVPRNELWNLRRSFIAFTVWDDYTLSRDQVLGWGSVCIDDIADAANVQRTVPLDMETNNGTGELIADVELVVHTEEKEPPEKKCPSSEMEKQREGKMEKQKAEEAKKAKEEEKKQRAAELERRKTIPVLTGEYQVRCHIIEFRDLQPMDWGGTCDPSFRIECFGKTVNTKALASRNSGVVDELLILSETVKNRDDLRKALLRIVCLDMDMGGFTSEEVGSFTTTLEQLYFLDGHGVHWKWALMVRREVGCSRAKIAGYVRFSLSVTGPNDPLPEFASAPEEVNGLSDMKELKKMGELLIPRDLQNPASARLAVRILNGRGFAEMNGSWSATSKVDPFLQVTLGKQTLCTTVATPSNEETCTAVWDEELSMQVNLPLLDSILNIELRDYNFISGDQIMGRVELDLSNLPSRSTVKGFVKKNVKAKGWTKPVYFYIPDKLNFGGIVNVDVALLEDIDKEGDSSSSDEDISPRRDIPRQHVRQIMARLPELQQMRLQLLILQVDAGTRKTGESCQITAQFGAAGQQTTREGKVGRDGVCTLCEGMLWHSALPDDRMLCPGLEIFYTSKGGNRYLLRLAATSLSSVEDKDGPRPQWFVMQRLEDPDTTRKPGSWRNWWARSTSLESLPQVLLAVKLDSGGSGLWTGKQNLDQWRARLDTKRNGVSLAVNVQLYQAVNLPAMDEDGGLDAQVAVEIGGQEAKRLEDGTFTDRSTTMHGLGSPFFLQTLSFTDPVQVPKEKSLWPGLRIKIYDRGDENDEDQEEELCGAFWVPMQHWAPLQNFTSRTSSVGRWYPMEILDSTARGSSKQGTVMEDHDPKISPQSGPSVGGTQVMARLPAEGGPFIVEQITVRGVMVNTQDIQITQDDRERTCVSFVTPPPPPNRRTGPARVLANIRDSSGVLRKEVELGSFVYEEMSALLCALEIKELNAAQSITQAITGERLENNAAVEARSLDFLVLGIRGLRSGGIEAVDPWVEVHVAGAPIKGNSRTERRQTCNSQDPEPENCNFLERLKLKLGLPGEDVLSAGAMPSMSFEVKDSYLAGYVTRTIGSGTISLAKMLDADKKGTSNKVVGTAFKLLRDEAEKMLHAISSASDSEAPPEEEAEELEEEMEQRAAARQEKESHQTEERVPLKENVDDPANQSSLVKLPAPPSPVKVGLTMPPNKQGVSRLKTWPSNAERIIVAQRIPSSTPLMFKKGAKIAAAEGAPGGLNNHEAEDTESDEEEELPEWLVGREQFSSELERVLGQAAFNSYPIFRGRGEARQKVGLLKGLLRLAPAKQSSTFAGMDAETAARTMMKVLQPKPVVARVYILEARGLTALGQGLKASEVFAKVRLGAQELGKPGGEAVSSMLDASSLPVYRSFELPTMLPGPSSLRCELWDANVFTPHEQLCSTTIDLEDRWYNPKWRTRHKERPPVEWRNLRRPGSLTAQGALSVFVELLTPEEAKLRPLLSISPLPRIPFELRVVIWETKGVPYGDYLGGMSDMYIRGWVPAGPGEDASKAQDTDTHWRAKKGRGCFNYRFKFELELPLSPIREKMFLQVWDADPLNPIKPADLRGEAIVPLRKIARRAYRVERSRLKTLMSQNQDSLENQCSARRIAGKVSSTPKPPKNTKKGASKIEDKGQTREKEKGLKEKDKNRSRNLVVSRCPFGSLFSRYPGPPPESEWVTFKLYDDEMGARIEAGAVAISMVLVPASAANRTPVGCGRREPNSDPYLPEPSGRINIMGWWNPYNLIWDLFGPKAARCLCCVLFVVVLLVLLQLYANIKVIGDIFSR